MKPLHYIVKFKEPVQCERDNEEEVKCCEHKTGGKRKMPCKMCLGRNKRDDNVAEEYPVDEYGRRVNVIRPQEWQERKGVE